MKKKKMALVAIALFVLVATATAWNLGNTLSPAEFANVDIDKHNFNPTPTGTTIIGEGSGALYRANVQVDSFAKVSASEYEEVNRILTPQVGVRQYVNCRDSGGSIGECDTAMETALINAAAQRVISEKDLLKKEQINAAKFALYAGELQAGDITITAQEINDAIAAQLGE